MNAFLYKYAFKIVPYLRNVYCLTMIRLRDKRLLFTCILYLNMEPCFSFQVPSDANKRHHFNRCCIMEISRE